MDAQRGQSARPALSLKRKLLFATILVIAVLLLLEAGVRLAGLPPQSSAQRLEHHLVADPRLGFVYEPNQQFRASNIRGQPVIHTDSAGRRVTVNPAWQSDQPVVLCIGDSTTFCAEVEDEHTWPSHLARLLSATHPSQVVNAAVRGYSTVQSARMLDRILGESGAKEGAGIRVAIYLYTENDLIENVNPIVYYPLQSPVMRVQDGALHLIEVADPAVPWGQSFSVLVNRRETSWISHSVDFVRQHSALANFVIARLRGHGGHGTGQWLTGPDGCHGPVWQGHPSWPAEVAWAKAHHAEAVLAEQIRWMNERCLQAGVKLLVAEYPVGKPEHTADIPAICRRAGAEFVDVTAAFDEPPDRYMAVRADGSIDGHLNMRGAEAMARALVPRVLEVLKHPLPASHHSQLQREN